MNIACRVLMSSVLPLVAMLYVPAGVANTVVIVRVVLNVGVPEVAVKTAVGQFGLQVGPVTTVLKVMLLEVP